MSVNGLVTSVQWVPQGSELTAAAILGATTLAVESTVDFDDAGGDLEINGDRYEYETCDEDALTVTLTSGLLAAAAADDRVFVVAGGQVAVDYLAFVTMGEGDDAEVEIPFSARALWPEGDYTNPVPVLLSDDLETIESVPGRTPEIDGGNLADDSVTASKISADAIDGRTITGVTVTGSWLDTTVVGGFKVIIGGKQIALVSSPGGIPQTVIDDNGIDTQDPIVTTDAIYSDFYQDNGAGFLSVGDTATPVRMSGSIKTGSESIAIGATGTPATAAVTFGTAFNAAADVPTIQLTVGATNPQNWAVGVSSISRSGFTINVTRIAGAVSPVTVYWTAIGMA